METTILQNSLQPESTSQITKKKRKPRHRRPKKQNSSNLEGDSIQPVAIDSHTTNSTVNSVENSDKPKRTRKRRRYFKPQPAVQSNKIENKSPPYPESEKVLEASVEMSVGNGLLNPPMMDKTREDDTRNREHVLAEREARRSAKHKVQDKSRNLENSSPTKSMQKPKVAVPQKNQPNVEHTPPVVIAENSTAISGSIESKSDKSREQILAERELKKQAKLANKNKTKENMTPSLTALVDNIANVTISDQPDKQDKPVLSKAERREKQEAQRAAKAKLLAEKVQTSAVQPTEKKADTGKVEKVAQKSSPPKKLISANINQHKVKLFNHLYPEKRPDTVLNSNLIHPTIVKLGMQYANGNIVGSNARCLAFMECIKMVIRDYETPSQKEFGRGLEAILQPSINFLQQCRPLSVSITNSLKFVKWQISQLPANQSDAELKEHLLESVDTYVRDQIEKATQAISITVQQKISNGDVILTFGCSSLISHIIQEAQKRKVDFSVIVVDSLPHREGQVMLRRLVAHNIPCSCVLINAIGFVMPEVTKVLLGANALMANGYVMSRAGTAEIALMAKFYNVPVLVCCETHKFSERVQTDAFVFNEIGDPQELVPKAKYASNEMENWRTIPQLTPLNLRYDITPPEFVSAVITELAILPCTSVPVILRIKPSEIGY